MNDTELTKVSQKDLDESNEHNDYIYSHDWKRLISCPPQLEEDDFNDGTYDFSGVKIICDNACDIDHCSWSSKDVDINIKIPEGVTHIGDFAFKGRKLGIVEIPNSLTYMGKNPFALTCLWKIINHNQKYTLHNENLVDTECGKIIHNIAYTGQIIIDDDIKIIGEYSFSRDEMPSIDEEDGELSIIIPSTVQEIGENAFENSNISSIIFLGMPKKLGNDIFKGCFYLEKIHVPNGLAEAFKNALPDNADLIDCSGDVVNGIVYRKILASNGITYFYKVICECDRSIYAYIKENKFHFSDENGNELRREDIGMRRGILVFDIIDELYTILPENKRIEGKAIAIDDSNNISWLESDADFYFNILDNQILIHKVEDLSEQFELGDSDIEYIHSARFWGENSESEITAYNDKLFVYNNGDKKQVIYCGKQYQELFDEIIVFEHGDGIFYNYRRNEILVSINKKWGMITQDGKYIFPQYKSIKELESALYKIETFDEMYGVINASGDVIICPTYRKLMHAHASNFYSGAFIVTDEDIYSVSLYNRTENKARIVGSCEIPEIEKCGIKKWGTQIFVRQTRSYEERATFLKIVKDDGKEFIYNNHCCEITDPDEIEKWDLSFSNNDCDWDWH